MSKQVAEESIKIKKTREKLRNRFNRAHHEITSDLLVQKKKEIQLWIDRHSAQRVSIKEEKVIHDPSILSFSNRFSQYYDKLRDRWEQIKRPVLEKK